MNNLNDSRRCVFKFSVLHAFISPSKHNYEQVYASLIYLHARNYILPITNVVCTLVESDKMQLVSWWVGT